MIGGKGELRELDWFPGLVASFLPPPCFLIQPMGERTKKSRVMVCEISFSNQTNRLKTQTGELRNATKEERTCAHAQKGNQATECGIQPKKGQPALPKQRCGKRQGPDRNRAVVKHTRPSLPSFFFPVEEERKDLTPPPPLWMEMESSSGNDAAKPDASAGATAAGSAGIGVSGAPANSGDGGVPASRNATQQELPQQQQQQHQQQQQQQQQSQHQQQVYATQGPAAINSAKTNVRGGAAAGDGNGKKGKTVAAKRNGKSGEPTGIGMPKKPSPRARTPKASKAAEGGETGAGKKKMTAAEKKKAAALAAQSGAQTTNGMCFLLKRFVLALVL